MHTFVQPALGNMHFVEVEHPLGSRVALGVRGEARDARIAPAELETRTLLWRGRQRHRTGVLVAFGDDHVRLKFRVEAVEDS